MLKKTFVIPNAVMKSFDATASQTQIADQRCFKAWFNLYIRGVETHQRATVQPHLNILRNYLPKTSEKIFTHVSSNTQEERSFD